MAKPLSDLSPAEFTAAYPAAVKRVTEHVNALPTIQIEFDPWVAFCVVSALQLALRHPAFNGPTSRVVRDCVDDMIAHLSDGDVEIAVLMKRGYEPPYDQVPPTQETRADG